MGHIRRIEGTVDHRPWPLPRIPWVMYQSWRDLLFAHWMVPPERLRPLVPRPLELDTYDGQAWIGITAFMIRDSRARGLPALPDLSDFPELNLRTYVRAGGKAGVHFFSLDAGSRAAVMGARTFYRLPYHTAEMALDEVDGRIRFRSERSSGEARFRASYEPIDHAIEAQPGTLEHFLTERYALFTVLRNGRVLKTEIHHRPWPLQPAEARIEENGLAAAENVPLPDVPPVLHFSRRLDTLIWLPMTLS